VEPSRALQACLADMPFFASLAPREIEAFAGIATRRRIADGALVVRQGELDCHLYAVAEGLLQVSSRQTDGKEINLNLLGPGDLFGEVALFDRRERSASVVAAQASVLLVFDREDVLAVVHRFPAIAIKFLECMAGRIRQLTSRAEHLTELSIASRIARKLLELGEQQGRRIGPNQLALPFVVTQQNLAKHVQTTRESVNRNLVSFAKQGLLQQTKSQLVILDCARLSSC
jgi:CRP/FNR family cyclic AMP-dependent transcriptional regulator